MKTLIATTALILAVAAGPAMAGNSDDAGASGDRCFNGYAYTLKGGDYRYTEHHEQHRANGKIKTWDVTYVGTDGNVIATKHMDFSDNPTVPVYTLEMRTDGYMEGISHDDGQWSMVRRESKGAEKETKAFDLSSTMAADSGFDPLLRSKFDALMNGKTIKFKFVAAGRQSVIDLRARRGDKTTFEGQPAVTFIAELDMMFINYFVDSLKLVYDPDTHRLLEYRGIGNLRNDAGKVYPVRVTYASQMPDVAREHGAPKADCGAINSQAG